MPGYGRTIVIMYGALVKLKNDSQVPNCQVIQEIAVDTYNIITI